MKVSVHDARLLMGSMGFPETDWTNKRLQVKLNKLKELVPTASKEPNGESLNLLKLALASLEEGEAIVLEGQETETDSAEEPTESAAEETEASNGDEAPKKKTKPKKEGKVKKKTTAKTKEKEKEKTKPTKSKREVDRFGVGKNSGAARINEVIGKKAKSPKEIAEESGQTVSRVNGHLRWLLAKGFVTNSEKGWVVTGGKK